MSTFSFQPAADLLGDWRDSVLSGTPPTLYRVGDGELARLEIGPGLVTLLGGAPGAGKTALVMQFVFEALVRESAFGRWCAMSRWPLPFCSTANSPDSAGSTPETSGTAGSGPSTARPFRGECTPWSMSPTASPSFEPPFNLENVAQSADEFGANLLIIDYIQRVGSHGEHGDKRGAVDATMSYLRQFADAGVALIVVSAVGRSKDSKGRSSYVKGLNLASFRESSELEFGADDAFILAPDDGRDASPDRVVLKHLKSRHGETKDFFLTFDRRHQRFTPAEPDSPAPAETGKLQAALRAAWGRTPPAAEEGDDDE